jgi:hypothetical protein
MQFEIASYLPVSTSGASPAVPPQLRHFPGSAPGPITSLFARSFFSCLSFRASPLLFSTSSIYICKKGGVYPSSISGTAPALFSAQRCSIPLRKREGGLTGTTALGATPIRHRIVGSFASQATSFAPFGESLGVPAMRRRRELRHWSIPGRPLRSAKRFAREFCRCALHALAQSPRGAG